MPNKVMLPDPNQAFTRGGNRLCFVDPGNAERCIKVLRQDRSPAVKRAEKTFPGKYKPLRHFDDNWQECRAYRDIEKRIGSAAFASIPVCFGFVDTNLGAGLCSELIRDHDGKISISLKQYIWQQGITQTLQSALDQFKQRWIDLAIPSRNLLLHNIVVQQDNGRIKRLVVIDGLGWPDWLAWPNWHPTLARYKAARKIARIDQTITALQRKQAENGDWGYHGWLNEEQRVIGHE